MIILTLFVVMLFLSFLGNITGRGYSVTGNNYNVVSCMAQGVGCMLDNTCCSGLCKDGRCEMCYNIGEECADIKCIQEPCPRTCCEGLACHQGRCVEQDNILSCSGVGEYCESDDFCCSGHCGLANKCLSS